MNKLVFLLMIIVLIVIFSCNRFEHKFEPEIVEENYIIDFFTTFADSIQSILPAANVSNIMDFYNNDYSNNGLIKTDVKVFYESFYLVNMLLDFEATIIDTNGLSIDWRLLVTNPVSETTYMDTIISDMLIETEDSYMFYGNQADLRNVVVELFTGKWCLNCPKAEDALHNLRQVYGSRFSYVEYHWNDELETDFAIDLFQYYPNAVGFPFGVINGDAGFIYITPSVEEVQAAVDELISPLLQQDPPALLEIIQASLAENTISGSIDITLNNVSTDNLALVLVLMENYNDEYLNYHGEPHHNIVLMRETIDISELNLTEPVSFELTELNTLPQWYIDNSTGLPDDLTLVLWVQTLETPYNQNTCVVHNVIEVQINN